jgi:hypothetical protein
LRSFLDKIESSYGRARRVWVMDRGIPTEAVLEEMRTSERAVFYLVGTPRSQIRQYEKKWLDLPWQKVRDAVEVKLFADAGELYVRPRAQDEEPCGGRNWRGCGANCGPCSGVARAGTSCCCASARRGKKPGVFIVSCKSMSPAKAKR